MKFLDNSGVKVLINKIKELFDKQEEKINSIQNSIDNNKFLYTQEERKSILSDLDIQNDNAKSSLAIFGKLLVNYKDSKKNNTNIYADSESVRLLKMDTTNSVLNVKNNEIAVKRPIVFPGQDNDNNKSAIKFWITDSTNHKGSNTYINQKEVWSSDLHIQRIYGLRREEMCGISDSLTLQYITNPKSTNNSNDYGPTLKLGYREGSDLNSNDDGRVFLSPYTYSSGSCPDVYMSMKQYEKSIKLYTNRNSSPKIEMYNNAPTFTSYNSKISIQGGEWLGLSADKISLGFDSNNSTIIGNFNFGEGIEITSDKISIRHTNELRLTSGYLYLDVSNISIGNSGATNCIKIQDDLRIASGCRLLTDDIHLENKNRQGYNDYYINDWIDQGLLSNLYDIKKYMDKVEGINFDYNCDAFYITITETNKKITFNYSAITDKGYIDWGDGYISYIKSKQYTHTYKNVGKYIIRFIDIDKIEAGWDNYLEGGDEDDNFIWEGNNLITKVQIYKLYMKSSVFSNCSNLQQINLMNYQYDYIGSFMFFNSALNSITIPPQITQVFKTIFNHSNLKEIHMQSITPPTVIDVNSIYYIEDFQIPNDCKIYVPKGSSENYKTAEHWNKYADRMYEDLTIQEQIDELKDTMNDLIDKLNSLQ